MARLLVFDGFVLISALVFFFYLFGLKKFLTNHGNNGCEMTYMYEYPQFVRVTLPPNITAEYRRYGLYAYSEGRHTQQTRNMQFSGIPVLFIPGQGGSLKQVRSLASVSLRKALGSDSPFHFDFFTLDLNEEYSAMFGGVLTDQTRFTVHAVQRILTLYRRKQPESIVLIGHSMGGMIAKGLFLEPDFPSHTIRLLVTLATPHSPVLLTDPLLRDFYHHVTPHWKTSSNATVVSLGGGVKDLVVRSGLTLTDHADISALTTAVSDVWMSVDHLCILWCKQLVLVVVRALFDCVDPYTLQISRDPQLRLNVFKYHLLERSAGKRYHESVHPAESSLQTGRTEWLELSRPQYSIHRTSLRLPLHLLVHLPSSTVEDSLAVTVFGHKARDWLFGCSQVTTVNGGRRVCTLVENLSSMGRIAPSKQRKHKIGLVNLQELRSRGLHFAVIRLPPSDEPISLSYDIFSVAERSVSVVLPRWLLPLQWTTLIPTTTPDAIFYTLDLPQLERPWQAFHLSLRVLTCTNMTHHAVATLHVPWSHQHSNVILRNNAEAILPIMLHTAQPVDWSGPVPYVTLHLDAKCQYSVQIQSSTVDSLAQLVRLYSSQLIAYMAAILLLTLRQQLLSLSSQQHCLLFHHALLEGAKPYYILPAVKIASNLLSWRSVPEPLRLLLPTPDYTSLLNSGLDFLLLPLILYSVTFAFTFLLGLLAYAGIVCSGSTINKFALKFVGKLAGVSRTWTDWLMAAVDKVPCVVSVAMVAILLSSCGGLAMLIGAIYYFMRVCGMYEDYIEQLFFAPIKYIKNTVVARWRGQQTPVVDDVLREAEELLSLKGLTEFNFHLTLVLLWGTVTVVHLPSVLVWAHNFKYNPVLDPDPATLVALVSSLCVAVLWTLETPICHSSGEMYKVMSNVMFILACLILIYCPISLYNLPVLTTTVFVCLALHQLYEWASRRWYQQPEVTLVPLSDTPLGSVQPSDEDSEEDKSETKPTIDENSPESEEESSPAGSEKSGRASPDRSESVSRKNSRTSELSMSSYEAVSLNELKTNNENKEKDQEDKQFDPELEGSDESEEEEENVDDEEEVEENQDDGRKESERRVEAQSKEELPKEQILQEQMQTEQKQNSDQNQLESNEPDKKEYLKLKRKQKKDEDEDCSE